MLTHALTRSGPMVCAGSMRISSIGKPERGVARAVQREELTLRELELLVDPEEQREAEREAAERLVQERRLERRVLRVSGRSVARVDLDRPRQRRRAAEQLLVEPVAPPADRLREREPGTMESTRSAKTRWRRRPTITAAIAPPMTAPQMPRPPSRSGWPAGSSEELVVGDHVVQPGADDPADHDPDDDVENAFAP